MRRLWILCLLFTAHYIEIPSLLQSFEAGGVLDACLLRRLRLSGFNGLVTFMLHNMRSVISSHSSLLCNRDSSYETWKDHWLCQVIPVLFWTFWHFEAGCSYSARSIHISLCHMEMFDISKGGTLIIVPCQDISPSELLWPFSPKKRVILRTHFVSTVSAHLVTMYIS